ncbi:MAG: phage holin family protein [Chitinophagales bacterium]
MKKFLLFIFSLFYIFAAVAQEKPAVQLPLPTLANPDVALAGSSGQLSLHYINVNGKAVPLAAVQDRGRMVGGIIMTSIGGALTLISIPLLTAGTIYLVNGYPNPGVPAVVVGSVFAGAGIPLLVIGVHRIKQARGTAYLQPVVQPNFGNAQTMGVSGGLRLHF